MVLVGAGGALFVVDAGLAIFLFFWSCRAVLAFFADFLLLIVACWMLLLLVAPFFLFFKILIIF